MESKIGIGALLVGAGTFVRVVFVLYDYGAVGLRWQDGMEVDEESQVLYLLVLFRLRDTKSGGGGIAAALAARLAVDNTAHRLLTPGRCRSTVRVEEQSMQETTNSSCRR